MRSNKFLSTHATALQLAPQPIFLPVRKQVADRIAVQAQEGISFELAANFVETLDRILNYSIDPEFRAPTPPQVRLACFIAKELGLDLEEEVLASKSLLERFITKYHPTLEKLREEAS